MSLDKLRRLLATARTSSSGGDVRTGSGAGGEQADSSLPLLLQDLIQADAARDLVAQEASSLIDTLARDSVWRSIGVAQELLDPLAPRPLPFFPQASVLLDALVPRLSDQERLVLARLPSALEGLLADGGQVRRSAPAPPATSLRRGSSNSRGDLIAAQIAGMPEVQRGLQWLLVRSVIEEDEQARAVIETVAAGLRERLRSRLKLAGVGDWAANVAADNALRLPWQFARSRETEKEGGREGGEAGEAGSPPEG